MKLKIITFILVLSLLLGGFQVEGKLTENGKKWIAQNFGVKKDDKYCYSYNQPTFYYYDPDTETEKSDSGTANAVAAFVTAKLTETIDKVYVRICDKKFYYADLKDGNYENDITLDDAKWVADNDGYPEGESQYCYEETAPTQEKGYLSLTEECKQYIARYLGEKVGDKYCFTDSTAKKVKFWTSIGEEQIGSTLDAVTEIAIFGGYSYEDPVNKVGKITADTLKQKNGGNALTNDDIVWIANHSDGADKYCYSPTTTGKSMLTENGKRWIAKNFGTKVGDKYCFTYSGINYYRYNPDTETEESKTGGTAQIVTDLVVANLTGTASKVYVKVGGKKFYYSDLKAGNDGNDVTLDDAKWVADHDGYPAGESQYCYAPETPTLTPTQSPTPAISQTTETITQTKTTPSTPGFGAILTAVIITLVLIRRYR